PLPRSCAAATTMNCPRSRRPSASAPSRNCPAICSCAAAAAMIFSGLVSIERRRASAFQWRARSGASASTTMTPPFCSHVVSDGGAALPAAAAHQLAHAAERQRLAQQARRGRADARRERTRLAQEELDALERHLAHERARDQEEIVLALGHPRHSAATRQFL